MRPRFIIAAGIFLFVGAVYIAAGPGRIDIIDGQYRFEVARNIVDDGSIQLRDPQLGDALNGVLGAYSPYGVSGSLTGVPLIVLANALGQPSQDRQQFFFSFTSGVFAAASMAVLFLFLTALGVSDGRALSWSLVAGFATLTFPVATSTFDQAQHGFFILCASMLAFMSARRDSMFLATAAGVALAFLVNFQQTYAILVPTIAVAALAPPAAAPAARRRGFERAAVVAFVGALGVLTWMSINNYRFGSLFYAVQVNPRHPPARGNPLIGLAGLLISPGKSIFLYSPPTALAVLALPRLVKRERRLGQAVVATCLAYLALISSLSFYGGDWCWGPRYFASILPLTALAFPLVPFDGIARNAGRAVIVIGLCVQALALTVDHHRFFYARSLPTFFWYSRPGFYFTHSALLARPGEVLESLRTGVPAEVDAFRPGPYQGLLTYAVFGAWGHPDLPSPQWMRRYEVFWLPRPWPLWTRWIPAPRRPVNVPLADTILAIIAIAGLAAMRGARRKAVA